MRPRLLTAFHCACTDQAEWALSPAGPTLSDDEYATGECISDDAPAHRAHNIPRRPCGCADELTASEPHRIARDAYVMLAATQAACLTRISGPTRLLPQGQYSARQRAGSDVSMGAHGFCTATVTLTLDPASNESGTLEHSFQPLAMLPESRPPQPAPPGTRRTATTVALATTSVDKGKRRAAPSAGTTGAGPPVQSPKPCETRGRDRSCWDL